MRERRAAWLVLGVGLLCWTASEVYDSAYLAHLKDPPYPSLSDLLALLFYPAGCVALVLLVRGRMRGARVSLWLDGVVAALAVCTIGEVAVFHQVLAGGSGAESSVQVATDLSYPIADIVTERIVHVLEPVEVDEHHRHFLFVALRAARRLLQAVV